VPVLRPFRALRYDPALVGDLSLVICPPYDVISSALRDRLLARHPRNAVRVELPVDHTEAATTLAAWRRTGVLRRDPRPAAYAYEQRFRLPGEDGERTQRGFFARLRLEAPGQGIRPHERTMPGPRAERLGLLRATGTDTSPIVVLAGDPDGRAAELLEGVVDGGPPAAEATDDGGVLHRLWVLTADRQAARSLLEGASADPLTIADGHHRYETALHYRDERRAAGTGARPGEAPEDHVLALVQPVGPRPAATPTVLPTHRLLVPPRAAGRLPGALEPYVRSIPRPAAELVTAFSPPFAAGGGGRFGLLLRGAAFELEARPGAVEPLFGKHAPAVVRTLDVAVLEAVLEAVLGAGLGAPATGTLRYTHDAREAAAMVDSGDAAAAFLLGPTPVESVIAVAAAGAVMPQKSTYFHPKVATGLVMDPLER
jgi:uncharacterized protein (DUF1015 family)